MRRTAVLGVLALDACRTNRCNRPAGQNTTRGVPTLSETERGHPRHTETFELNREWQLHHQHQAPGSRQCDMDPSDIHNGICLQTPIWLGVQHPTMILCVMIMQSRLSPALLVPVRCSDLGVVRCLMTLDAGGMFRSGVRLHLSAWVPPSPCIA